MDGIYFPEFPTKTKKKKTKIKTKSPYMEFKEWLFNPYPNAKLPDHVLKIVNARTVLCMFGNLGKLTIFLNKYFNKFNITYLNKEEFFIYIKYIIQKFRIDKRQFSFYKSEQRDTSYVDIHSKFFPHLKKYELNLLMELIKTDDDYDRIMESFGLTKYKVTKNKSKKSKTKKESKNDDNNTINNNNEVTTFEELKSLFLVN